MGYNTGTVTGGASHDLGLYDGLPDYLKSQIEERRKKLRGFFEQGDPSAFGKTMGGNVSAMIFGNTGGFR